MVKHILGGALAALLILSDRMAFVALAIAIIAVVKIVAGQAPVQEPRVIARAKIPSAADALDPALPEAR